MEDPGLVEHINELSERAIRGTDIEIVEVQLKGVGKARLLRVYIDKPAGVTHGDCELVSERLSGFLDEGDVIPDDSYTLEVSSPGLERKLTKPRDYERVVGQKIRLVVREPIDGGTRLEGKLAAVESGLLQLEIAAGQTVQVPLAQVQKANTKFDW